MAQARAPAPSVKRLMKEARTMAKLYDPDGDIHAAPIGEGDNLFDWHFTIRGPKDTPFQNGLYHGRLIFPPDYPMKPPEIFLLTVSGRFETNTKICLSISGYHPETWLPSWSIQTALIALQAFFVTDAKGAIGGINWPDEARESAAMKSHNYVCQTCGPIKNILNVKIYDRKGKELKRSRNDTTTSAKEKDETSVETNAAKNPAESDKTESPKQSLPASPTKSRNSTSTSSSPSSKQKRQEILEKKRNLEIQMMKNQQKYQQDDLISLVFLILVIGMIGFLIYRRVNGEVSDYVYVKPNPLDAKSDL